MPEKILKEAKRETTYRERCLAGKRKVKEKMIAFGAMFYYEIFNRAHPR